MSIAGAIASDFLLTSGLCKTGGAEPDVGMSKAEAIYPHTLSDNFGFIKKQKEGSLTPTQ